MTLPPMAGTHRNPRHHSSEKARAGIIRRAKQKGKPPPEVSPAALQAQIQAWGQETAQTILTASRAGATRQMGHARRPPAGREQPAAGT